MSLTKARIIEEIESLHFSVMGARPERTLRLTDWGWWLLGEGSKLPETAAKAEQITRRCERRDVLQITNRRD